MFVPIQMLPFLWLLVFPAWMEKDEILNDCEIVEFYERMELSYGSKVIIRGEVHVIVGYD